MVRQSDKIQNKNQDFKVSGPAFKNLEELQSVQYLSSKKKLFTEKKQQNILQNRDISSDFDDSKNLFKLHNVQIKQIIQQFNYKDIIENQNQKDLEDEVKNQAKREDIMTDLMYKLHPKQYPDPDYSKEMKVVVKNQIENKCQVDHRTDLQENPKRIQINKKVHKQFAEKLQKAVRLKNNKLKLVQEQWKQNQAKANCKFQQDDEKIKLPKLAKRIANTFKDVMDFAQQHQNSQFSEKLMYFKEGVQMFYDMNEEEMYQKQKIFDQKRKLYGHQFANKSEAAQFYLLKEFQMAQKRIQKDLNRKQKSLGLKEKMQEESKFQRQKEEYLESIKEQDDLQKIQEKKLKVLKNMEKKQSLRKLEKYEKEYSHKKKVLALKNQFIQRFNQKQKFQRNNLNFQEDSSFSDSDEEIEVQQLYGNKEENQEDAYLSLLKYFKTKQNLPEGSMVLEKNLEMRKFLQAYYQDNCNLGKLQLEEEKQEDVQFNQFLRELEEYRGLNGILDQQKMGGNYQLVKTLYVNLLKNKDTTYKQFKKIMKIFDLQQIFFGDQLEKFQNQKKVLKIRSSSSGTLDDRSGKNNLSKKESYGKNISLESQEPSGLQSQQQLNLQEYQSNKMRSLSYNKNKNTEQSFIIESLNKIKKQSLDEVTQIQRKSSIENSINSKDFVQGSEIKKKKKEYKKQNQSDKALQMVKKLIQKQSGSGSQLLEMQEKKKQEIDEIFKNETVKKSQGLSKELKHIEMCRKQKKNCYSLCYPQLKGIFFKSVKENEENEQKYQQCEIQENNNIITSNQKQNEGEEILFLQKNLEVFEGQVQDKQDEEQKGKENQNTIKSKYKFSNQYLEEEKQKKEERENQNLQKNVYSQQQQLLSQKGVKNSFYSNFSGQNTNMSEQFINQSRLNNQNNLDQSLQYGGNNKQYFKYESPQKKQINNFPYFSNSLKQNEINERSQNLSISKYKDQDINKQYINKVANEKSGKAKSYQIFLTEQNHFKQDGQILPYLNQNQVSDFDIQLGKLKKNDQNTDQLVQIKQNINNLKVQAKNSEKKPLSAIKENKRVKISYSVDLNNKNDFNTDKNLSKDSKPIKQSTVLNFQNQIQDKRQNFLESEQKRILRQLEEIKEKQNHVKKFLDQRKNLSLQKNYQTKCKSEINLQNKFKEKKGELQQFQQDKKQQFANQEIISEDNKNQQESNLKKINTIKSIDSDTLCSLPKLNSKIFLRNSRFQGEY